MGKVTEVNDDSSDETISILCNHYALALSTILKPWEGVIFLDDNKKYVCYNNPEEDMILVGEVPENHPDFSQAHGTRIVMVNATTIN